MVDSPPPQPRTAGRVVPLVVGRSSVRLAFGGPGEGAMWLLAWILFWLNQVWSVWAAGGMAAVALTSLFIDEAMNRRRARCPTCDPTL